jgi:serine/threonine-protein kinase
MPIPTIEERVGTVVDGKYRVDRILGKGGMGVVYACMHLALERPVALKFLHPRLTEHREIVGRFMREARATSRLSHPNVVDVRDVDVLPDGSVYMVLELLEGESLASYLERVGRLSLAETLELLLPVMDALAVAHAAGIVHRDVKPENVFLARVGDRVVPKVLDFGIAKLADAESQSSTATGSVLGTPLYMAPEQAMGRTSEIGACSDVWSMGVMVYECLTGELPFEVADDATPAAIVMSVMTGRIAKIEEKRPDLPPAFAALVGRALELLPVSRVASMRELGEGLRAATESRPPTTGTQPGHSTAPPTSRPPRRIDTDAETLLGPAIPRPPARADAKPADRKPAEAEPARPPPAEVETRGPTTAMALPMWNMRWLWGAGAIATVAIVIAALTLAGGAAPETAPPPSPTASVQPRAEPPPATAADVPPPSIGPSVATEPPATIPPAAEPVRAEPRRGRPRSDPARIPAAEPPPALAAEPPTREPQPRAEQPPVAQPTVVHRAGGVSVSEFE